MDEGLEGLPVSTEAIEITGALLRAARVHKGLSLTQMAERTHYSKPYLGLVETGHKPATSDLVRAYERVLGDDMWRQDIRHPRLITIDKKKDLPRIQANIESGDPDIFAKGPTSNTIDASVAPIVGPGGVKNLRKWATEGKTSTLRANAVSVIGRLPGRENADLSASVMENDLKVRRLCVASVVSRLTQLDWALSLRVADDPTSAPNPRKLATKLAREATDQKDTISRWCASHLLQRMSPVLGR